MIVHTQLQMPDDDLTTADMMRLAEAGGAFAFWQDEGEDVYSIEDGEPAR